jgi:predicted nucleic acid-binding protein
MARGILLDSSVVIDHLRGKLDIASFVPPAEPIFLSLTALGELYKGVLKSGNPAKNRARLDIFLQTVAVLHPDTATALHYAQIATALEKRERRSLKTTSG